VGLSTVRTGSERPEPGVRQLQGAWSLPKATEKVSTEPHAQVTRKPSKPVATPVRPAARVVTGPWTAVVRGNRLTLRDPATNTAIVQRIDSPQPGRFSVVEASSGGTASFGCSNVGEYSFDRSDGGTLHVQEVADACVARAEILVAGAWTGLPPISTANLPTPEATDLPSSSQEPSPSPSVPEPDPTTAEEPPPPPPEPLSTP
jgi:hypothetical protein